MRKHSLEVRNHVRDTRVCVWKENAITEGYLCSEEGPLDVVATAR